MRARYYSPDMRRFINADVVAGSISNAITLNRFAYANGNPVSMSDPFGLSAENRCCSVYDDITIQDLKRANKTFDAIYDTVDALKDIVNNSYSRVNDYLKNLIKPKRIPDGSWVKRMGKKMNLLDDLIGPTSKTAKSLDALAPAAIDVVFIVNDVLLGVCENVENNVSDHVIAADAIVDVAYGATGAISSGTVSAAVGAKVGAVSFIPVPGLGTAIGVAVGVGAGLVVDAIFEKIMETPDSSGETLLDKASEKISNFLDGIFD
ncbi:MAG: RHS repeat-associated core domain-containing protein [Clostridia bacterium]|nr:RHS repeat-associated core domain-containing protein [Clostridia bacterium]